MKTKEEIINNWLPRYTGIGLKDFGEYILLVNFTNYVHLFAQKFSLQRNNFIHFILETPVE